MTVQHTDPATAEDRRAAIAEIRERFAAVDGSPFREAFSHWHLDDVRTLLSELEAAQARLDKALEARSRLEIQLEDGELSDGYHTHNELYEYRLLYNAHAARGWVAAGYPVVKSWRHSDGEECFGGGWFVVAAELPTGQVTNHYKADDWGLFEVPEAETAYAWDGHTPAEAAERLRAALGLGEEGDE